MQRLAFCAALSISLSSLTHAQVALGNDTEKYGDNFGRQSDLDGAGNTTGGQSAAEEAKAGEEAMQALRQLGSFPVRIHLGEAGGDRGWVDNQWRNYTPKPVERRYKVRDCEFKVQSGDFTLRRYEREADGNYAVNTDPIERFATLDVNKAPMLVSVSTDLYATVTPETRAACKQVFETHRVRLGTVDLAHTDLITQAEAGGETPASVVRSSTETTVYLSWDSVRDDLSLQDPSGLAPAVESAIFTVQPRTAGDYYLAVTPKLGLQRPLAKSR